MRADGVDQNSGVETVNNLKPLYAERASGKYQKQCLEKCHAYTGATGCEIVWNTGCFIHTSEIAKGNGAAKHNCWVFSKCALY